MKESAKDTELNISPNWSDLSAALKEQDKFSKLFFDSQNLSLQQKQELMKTFVLSLHAEATGIVGGVNYKDHRLADNPVDLQKILYKSVDAYRYILAILNLWGIDGKSFEDALSQKDDYLHYRHSLTQKSWKGEPIVLFDLDDVLAEFRAKFCEFVTKDSGVFIDPQCQEYYNIVAFRTHGLSNEYYFRKFVDSHGFLDLDLNQKYFGFLQKLKAAGCWIQVVTARPGESETCFYDTYSWLARKGIPADGVVFTPEKFSWLASQKFYNNAKFFAVDDSAKHVAEYVKHGVAAVVPQQPYNKEVANLQGAIYVKSEEDPWDLSKHLLDQP